MVNSLTLKRKTIRHRIENDYLKSCCIEIQYLNYYEGQLLWNVMCCHAAFLIITNKTYDVYKFKHLMLSHSKLESTSMDAVWAYLAFILDLQDNSNCNT